MVKTLSHLSFPTMKAAFLWKAAFMFAKLSIYAILQLNLVY